MTSGADRASHAPSWSSRDLTEFTFHEAMRIRGTLPRVDGAREGRGDQGEESVGRVDVDPVAGAFEDVGPHRGSERGEVGSIGRVERVGEPAEDHVELAREAPLFEDVPEIHGEIV